MFPAGSVTIIHCFYELFPVFKPLYSTYFFMNTPVRSSSVLFSLVCSSFFLWGHLMSTLQGLNIPDWSLYEIWVLEGIGNIWFKFANKRISLKLIASQFKNAGFHSCNSTFTSEDYILVGFSAILFWSPPVFLCNFGGLLLDYMASQKICTLHSHCMYQIPLKERLGNNLVCHRSA